MFDKLLMAAAQPVAATDSDQYIANTELLLKGEGTNGQTNNTFVDSSASNHSITPYNDVTQGSFSPFSPKGWSGYFQGAASIGNSDCLTTPSITDFSFGTGDFTIEAWVYWENYNDWKYIVDTRNSSYTSGRWLFIGGYQTGLLQFYDSTADRQTSSTVQVPLHQWTHVAVSRTSGTLKMYINGVSGYTNTNHTVSTNAPPSGGGDVTIGSRYLKEKPFYGYLSNLRIVKGTGLYPNDFTPPSEPLTAVTNTKLLTLQDNRFVDNSPNNLTLTTHNEPAIKPTSPFSGNREYPKASYFSGKFDGSNDYLNCGSNSDFAFGTGEFTVEAWVYSNGTQTSSAGILSIGTSGTNAGSWQLDYGPSQYSSKWGFAINSHSSNNYVNNSSNVVHNQWTHLAASRDSNNLVRLFVDGALVDSMTISTDLSTTGPLKIGVNRGGGAYFDGYISNARVVKGTCLYTTTFTPPTAPLTPVANTKLLTLQDNYLVDHSSSGHSITNNGGVTLEPESPFSNSTYPLSGTFYSGNFDGTTSDYLQTPSSTDFSPGTGDWTTEGWVYLTAYPNGKWGRFWWPSDDRDNIDIAGTDTSHGLSVGTVILNRGGGTLNTSDVLPLNQWVHIAVVRYNDTSAKIFFNGVEKASSTSFTNPNITASRSVYIGANGGTGSNIGIPGYISNVRYVRKALYTTDFTVPTEPLTSIGGTNYTQKISSINNPQGNFTTANAGKLFDGSLVYGLGGGTAGAGYAQVNFSGITWSSSIEVAVATGSTSSQVGTNTNFIRVNGYDIVPEVKTAGNYLSVSWVDITSKLGSSGTLNNLGAEWINNVANPTFFGIKIDGVVLKDSFTALLTLQDATIQDNSASNHSITNNGATVTEIAPFGAALIDRAGSMYFDGSGDYIQSPYSSEHTFGTGDFTIECWIYRKQPLSSLNTGIAGIWSGAYGSVQAWLWYIDSSNELRFINNHATNEPGDDQIFTSPATIGLNQWYHIAVTRNGNVWKTFVNGTQEAINSNYSSGMRAGSNPLVIGDVSDPTSSETPFKGYISDFRITKGTALYTSNFTPPTAPLQPITNTKLLLSGNNGGVEDSLGKANCETNGNIAIDTSVKKFGVGSFEGGQTTGDYLSFPADDSYDISDGVFTIECWFRNKGASGVNNVGICNYGGNTNAYNSTTGYQYNFSSQISGALVFNALNSAKNNRNQLISATGVISVNTWHYVVVVGDGSNYSLFVDGTRVATNTTSKPYSTTSPEYFTIGGQAAHGGGSQGCAYYDDFRFTKGVARYDPTQTSHTVPTKTHPTI